MTKRTLKHFGLLLALALLFAGLFCAAALANSPEPAVTVTVDGQAPVNGRFTGSSFYRVWIEATDVEHPLIQTGFSEDVTAEEPDGWSRTSALEDWNENGSGTNRYHFISWNGGNPDYKADALFVRLVDEKGEQQGDALKVCFQYDKTAPCFSFVPRKTEVGIHEDVVFDIWAPGVENGDVEIYVDGEPEDWAEVEEDDERGDYGVGEWRYAFHDEEEEEYEYTVRAKARFDGAEVESPEWKIQVGVTVTDWNPAEVTWQLAGDSTTFARDGMVEIEADYVEGAEFFEAFIDSKDGWLTKSGWVRANPDANDNTWIGLPLLPCEPGKYTVRLYACKPGARYAFSKSETEITVAPPKTSGDILITVEQNLVTCQRKGLAAYFVNDEHLKDVWMNVRAWPKDKPGEIFYDENHGIAFYDDDFMICDSGDYIVEATVYQDVEDDEPERIASARRQITVTAKKGPIGQDYAPEMPDILPLTLNEDVASISIPFPENAQWMDVHVFDRYDNCWFEDYGLTEATVAEFNTWPDNNVRVEVDAFAYDYEALHWRSDRIPVGEQNPLIHLTVDDPTLLDENGVVHVDTNQPVYMTVRADADFDIKTVRFFGGYDFWGDEDPEDDGKFYADPGFDSSGSYTVYAMVTAVEWQDEWEEWDHDPRTWYVTNTVRVEVEAAMGPVPPFTIALTEGEVSRGEDAEVVFTREVPAGFDMSVFDYQIKVWCDTDEDEEGWDYQHRWSWKDSKWTDVGAGRQQRTALLHTSGMPKGDYCVVAEGYAPQYENYSTDFDGEPESLAIRDDAPDHSIRFTVDRTEADTEEQIGLNVYAPGADWIDIFFDWHEDDEGRSENWDGDSVCDQRSYGNGGAYTMLARAHYLERDEHGEPIQELDEEGHEIWKELEPLDSDPIEITINAPKGPFDISFIDQAVKDLPTVLTVDETGNITGEIDFTVELPGGACNLDVHMSVNDGGDFYDEGVDRVGDSLRVQYSAAQLKALNLQPGDFVEVSINVHAPGYDCGNWSRTIPVMSKPDSRVSIEVTEHEGTYDGGVYQIPASTSMEVKVSTTGSDSIRAVRIFDGEDFRGEIGPDDEENPSYSTARLDFGRGGRYVVYAMVTYDEWKDEYENGEDKRQWIFTNSLTVNVEQLGEVGEFTIALSSDHITAGKPVEVTFTQAENAEDYGVNLGSDQYPDNDDLRVYDWDWCWKGDWHKDDEGRTVRTAVISTAGLIQGEYWVEAWANATGYEGNGTERLTLTVSDPDDMPDILFVVDRDEVTVGEELTFSIRANGADNVELNQDYPYGRWDDRDRAQFSRPISYDEAGTYQLRARAWFPCWETDDAGNILYDDDHNPIPLIKTDEHGEEYHEHWSADSEILTVKVTSSGALQFDGIDGLPPTLTVNDQGAINEDLGFTVSMIENADTVEVNMYVEDSEEDFYNGSLHGEGALKPSFTAQALTDLSLAAGDVVVIEVNAYARGYDAVHWRQSIPVVAAASNDVSIVAQAVRGKGQYPNFILDDEVNFRVSAKSGAKLAAVRFYNGNGYWTVDEGNGSTVLTPGNREDCFTDDNKVFSAWNHFNDAGTFTVYAEVQLENSNNWLTTAPLTVNVASLGTVGVFEFTDSDDRSVPRGDTVDFTFTQATAGEGLADNYWVDAFDSDGNSYRPDNACNGETVTMETLNLPEGEYTIVGRAGKGGYQWRESTGIVRLTVTEYEGKPIQLTLRNNTLLTNENLYATIIAPGAKRVGFAVDGFRYDLDVNTNEYMWGDGETCTVDWPSWNNPGSYTAVAYAQYADDGRWVAGDPVTFTVTETNGRLSIDARNIPAYLTAGTPKAITVPWPEEARYLGFEVKVNEEEEPRSNCDNTEGEAATIDIGNVKANDIVHLSVWTSGVGYEHSHYNFEIPVMAESAAGGEVTLSINATGEPAGLSRHEEYTVTVHAKGADKVKLYDGRGFHRNEQGGEEFDVDGNGDCEFTVSYYDNANTTIKLFAMAEFGKDNWVTSASTSAIIVTSGPATATKVDVPEYVWKDSDAVVITIADPDEVGSWYHVSIWPRGAEDSILEFQYGKAPEQNWVDYEGESPYTGKVTITVPADELSLGTTYDVEVNFDQDGRDMNMVRQSFQVIEQPTVTLSADKSVYTYGDTVRFTVTAPLADSVELYRDGQLLDSIEEWVANDINDAITFTAKAYYDGREIESNTVTVRVRSLGKAPQPTMTYPQTLEEGNDLPISVSGVDTNGGAWFKISVSSGENVVFKMEENENADNDYSIDKQDLPAGTYTVSMDYGKTGYSDGHVDGQLMVAHSYNYDVGPAFNWNDDGSCTATITCVKCQTVQTLTPSVSDPLIVEPTCVDKGSKTYNATVEFDGHTYTNTHVVDIIPALGHTVNWQIHRDGQASYIHGTCARCHEEQVVDGDAFELSATTITEVSCTTDGETKYTITWGEYSDNWTETVTKLGHNYGAYEVTTPATCQSFGVETKTCSRCQKQVTRNIAKLDHSWTPEYTWALDNSSVTASAVCADCDQTLTETVNTVAGVTKAATCTEMGETTYTATFTYDAPFATQTKTVANIDMLPHDWNAPTYVWAADNRSVTASAACTVCGQPLTETVNTVSAETKAATCAEMGETTWTATFTEPAFATQTKTEGNIDMIPHTLIVHARVDAGCETPGTEAYWQCSVCQKLFSDAEGKNEITAPVAIPAIDHNWGTPTYEWAADNSSVKATRVCANNATHVQTETATATVTSTATCVAAGETIWTAAFTNTAFATQTKSSPAYATGVHAWDGGVVTTAATCTKTGVKTYTCATCGTTTPETIPATGVHVWDGGVVTTAATCAKPGVKTYTCATCGTTTSETIPATGVHAWDGGVVTTPATCGTPGVKTYTCATCGTTTSEEIPATGVHTWGAPTYAWAADNSSVTASAACAVCGQPLTETVATVAAVTKPATETEMGETTYTATFVSPLFAPQTRTVANIPVTPPSKTDIATCTFTVEDKVYTGKEIQSKVTVKNGKTTLKKGRDYTLTYKNNKEIGLATVTVKAATNSKYTGSKKLTFKINPKGTTLGKLTGKKKQIDVKWAIPKNVKITGYEIEYSLNSDFKDSNTLKVKKATTDKASIKKLVSKKTYYLRIRTYTTVKKKNYVSAWSKTKTVKTK